MLRSLEIIGNGHSCWTLNSCDGVRNTLSSATEQKEKRKKGVEYKEAEEAVWVAINDLSRKRENPICPWLGWNILWRKIDDAVGTD